MCEDFVIGNNAWAVMPKRELLELPWIKDAEGDATKLVLINSCLGFHVGTIQDGGSILDPRAKRPFYILKNVKNPSRFRIKEMHYDETVQSYIQTNLTDVYSATVTTDFETGTGPRVCSVTSTVYRYDKNGAL